LPIARYTSQKPNNRARITMPPSKRAKRTSTMDSLATTASASSAVAEPTSTASKLPYLPSKRRQVKIADDADLVLAKCRKLRDALRMKAMMKQSNSDDSDDDEWGGKKKKAKTTTTADYITSAVKSNPDAINSKSFGAKTQQLSLAELKSSRTMSADGKKKIVEVVEMNTTEVIEGIENVAVVVAHQVLAKQGFQLGIPSRAASNQIYVPELDRIVLGDKRGTRSFLNVKESRKAAITTRVLQLLHAVLQKRIHITKRDLFYTDVKLFVDQTDSDGVLDDVATMIGCTRSNLHVVASDKGLVVGRISFFEDGDFIDCTFVLVVYIL